MATQFPLFLMRNAFTIPGGFAIGPLPITANVGQNAGIGDAILCGVHPRANSFTIHIAVGSGSISFGPQTPGTPMAEPFYPLSADTPHTFDISNHPLDSVLGLKLFHISFNGPIIDPPNLISGVATA